MLYKTKQIENTLYKLDNKLNTYPNPDINPDINPENILEMASMISETMYVIKRTGEREEVSFDKCLKRIQKLSKD